MTQSDRIAIVWFRRDLRLRDNPAWAAATSRHEAVVPLFVLDPRLLATAGPYRRRYLVASLQALDYDLFEQVRGRLLVRVGDPTDLVPEAATVLQAGAVHWNGDTTAFARRRDRRVRDALPDGVTVSEWWGTLVHPPGSVVGDDGSVPDDLDAFVEAWERLEREPWPSAGRAVVYDDPGEPLPRLDGRPPLPEGEGEAQARLERFVAGLGREPGPSLLSADLRFGIISPRVVLDAVEDAAPDDAASTFRRRLARRDWLAHLAAHDRLPATPPAGPPEPSAGGGPAEISAWKGGFTGYPAVDAAMRQLREAGWMPDHARRLAARFLVDDLGVDWRVGEAHFRHLLVDADVTQNVGNWVEVASVRRRGPSAASTDPAWDVVAEGRSWDPDGTHVRRWVTELAGLDGPAVHAPWELGADELAAAGVRLGSDYPERVVSSRSPSAAPPAPSDG